jgi:cell division protein FtsW
MGGTQKKAVSMPFYDVQMLMAVLFLVGMGIVMVYSASSNLALNEHGSDLYFLKKQAFYSLLGILALVACAHIPYRFYRALTYPALFLALGLMMAVLLTKMGMTVNGSSRWLQIGPVTFQPSELARIVLVMYLAYSLNKKQDSIRVFSIGFVPHFLLLAVFSFLLVMQPDFGSTAIFIALTCLMMFVGGVPLRHLAVALLVLPSVGIMLMKMAGYRYPIERILTVLNPEKDPFNKGWQINCSLDAFRSGGFIGTGIGNEYQISLPEPHTDFIFSVIGQELGFVGVLVIIVLFGLILWRGTLIACQCKDRFGMLLATGLIISIGLNASINMGVCLGMLPPKGLTLPFLSYGGTSLLLNMACIGILMNIGARHVKGS